MMDRATAIKRIAAIVVAPAAALEVLDREMVKRRSMVGWSASREHAIFYDKMISLTREQWKLYHHAINYSMPHRAWTIQMDMTKWPTPTE